MRLYVGAVKYVHKNKICLSSYGNALGHKSNSLSLDHGEWYSDLKLICGLQCSHEIAN